MRALVIVATLAGMAACVDNSLDELQAIQHEVCACKTSSCGEAAMKKIPQRDVRASRESQAIARKVMDCMAKLYLADRPSTDPDQEAPGSAAP